MHLTRPCIEPHSGASLSTATGVLKVGWSCVGQKAGAFGGGGGSQTRNVKRRVSIFFNALSKEGVVVVVVVVVVVCVCVRVCWF